MAVDKGINTILSPEELAEIESIGEWIEGLPTTYDQVWARFRVLNLAKAIARLDFDERQELTKNYDDLDKNSQPG